MTGRSNMSSLSTARGEGAPDINISARNSGRRVMEPAVSGRQTTAQNNAFDEGWIPRSNRSDASELTSGEVLKRLRDKVNAKRFAQDEAEINALGEYNAFSRPRASSVLPLRSVLLDPSINNFPPSQTRTELMKKVKLSGFPHPSYDLDADGYVSQEDYRLAKRFDLDGNGVLDPSERQIGKRVLADEFFKTHQQHLHVFGPGFANNPHKKNVENLANAYSFERAYDRLKSIERTLIAESSKPILECMQAPDQSICKHNFYTDKFDSTAWNDFDAIPRAASQYSLEDHGGSRKRLMFTRRQGMREECQARMDVAHAEKPLANTRRLKLITNIDAENS